MWHLASHTPIAACNVHWPKGLSSGLTPCAFLWKHLLPSHTLLNVEQQITFIWGFQSVMVPVWCFGQFCDYHLELQFFLGFPYMSAWQTSKPSVYRPKGMGGNVRNWAEYA